MANLPASLRGRLSQVREYLVGCVRIDSRSLALFRIGLGLLAVADVLLRSRNFSFYYTNDGVMPQSIYTTSMTDSFSVFHLTTDPTLIAILFVIHALVAIQLVVGYKTRVAAIITFLFVISLDHHNPFITSYADVLYRLLLFWAIFLPIGERWSIDAVHRDREPRKAIASLVTLFAMGQMIMMYFINGYHKTRSDIWGTGDAAPLVMGIDEMTFLLGDFMRNFPTFLEVGGLIWFFILVISPLLILLRGIPRYLLLALFAGGHASFAITVRIGAFAYVALTGLTLFLQTQFWTTGRAVLGMVGVGERFDDVVTRLRATGVRTARWVPAWRIDSERAQSVRETTYVFAVAVIAITIAFVLLLTGLQFLGVVDDAERHYDQIDDTASTFSVDQPEWSIFAPTPRTTDRYHVAPAVTEDGDHVDAFNDRPLTYDRPYDELQKQHDTYRMRFYMNSVRRGSPDRGVTTEFIDHLCTRWAEEHGTELTHINLWEIREDITRETVDNHEDRERSSRSHGQYTCTDDVEPREIEPPDF